MINNIAWSFFEFNNGQQLYSFFLIQPKKLMDRLQILLLILSEIKRIKFCTPWNHQQTIGFVLPVQINKLAQIHLSKI